MAVRTRPSERTRPATDGTAFCFATKARNLAQLRGRLAHSQVLPMQVLTVSRWRGDPAGCRSLVAELAGGSRVIVRSSAPGEDSLQTSHAGEFDSVMDVDPVEGPIDDAVAAVIDSYERLGGPTVDDFELLVQPMVPAVRMSGVVFTRDLERNSPYFVLNYDDRTSRTDTVTAGSSAQPQSLRVFRGADLQSLPDDLRAVIRMVRELEGVTGSDALDVEFAIGADDLPYLLQVRPLARTRILSLPRLDQRITREVEGMKDFVRARLGRQPHLFGDRAILGDMPDWNPAEIIGTHPKPLARSLYRHLVMRSTWREARGLVGYRDPFPHELMVVVGGHPYVDVRASFNSLLPAELPDELSERLVEHYLERLRAFPELHDKVEFEIAITCLAFDFDLHASRLREAGFEAAEVAVLREALRELTERLVVDSHGVLAGLRSRVGQLGPRRNRILASHAHPRDVPMVVRQLLDDCILFGTVPFSVFARCAFVGTSLLRSLVQRGVLTQDDSHRYLQGIDTVAHEFVADLDACRSGLLDRRDFLARYGHLRPGTYDICTPSYAEQPEAYLAFESRAPAGATPNDAPADDDLAGGPLAKLPPEAREAATTLLREAGFTFSLDDLEGFIRHSIQSREAMKFEFTKNLSVALDLVTEFGAYHGLSREDLSFLHVDDLLELSEESFAEDHETHLRSLVERNRHRAEVTAALQLPDLVLSERDVDVVTVQRRRPNFTTGKRIVAEAHVLDDLQAVHDDGLRGKIVLVENADPGYDWLFGKGIAGLVTKYGGAASHMTIRCAEFGLPAAIGCGEQIFDHLRGAPTILLDCAEQRVESHGS